MKPEKLENLNFPEEKNDSSFSPNPGEVKQVRNQLEILARSEISGNFFQKGIAEGT
mgnify:CR=1 FL=1